MSVSPRNTAPWKGLSTFVILAVLAMWPVLAQAADRGAWAAGVAYAVADVVSYSGQSYDCRQAHTSQVGWEPPNVPALWSVHSGGTTSDTQAPSTPSGVSSPSKTSSSVSLSWSASTDNVGVTGYEVFVGSSSTAATTSTTTSATVSGLSANTTYTFTVKARDAAGNRSAASTAFSTTTSAASAPDTQAPSTPASLHSTGVTSSSVSLAWSASTDNVGVTAYDVYVGSSTTAATSSSSTSATVSGLSANTVYTFTVKARDAAGNRSTASNSASATTSAASTGGSVPSKILVGYWHNFDNGSGFIKLRNVSPNWDVINVSFAEPTNGATGGTIGFTPYSVTDTDFKADVAYLQSQGKKVLISIGGANGQVQLTTTTARDAFVSSMNAIVDKYGFDGVDIDFEGHSLQLNAGDSNFKAPTTPVIVNLISALRSIHDHVGSKFMLTMAPETFFVQLGYSFYGGTCSGCDTRAGAFLPVIYAMRDVLNWLQVQDYNSGPITGLDNQYHNMGSADFHVAMTDMLLTGFTVGGNTSSVFPALRPDQVVIGLPANQNAGGGYTTPADVQTAVNALVKGIPISTYSVRSTPANNKSFRGLMAWSVNWDAFANYEFTNAHRPYLDSLK